MALTDEQQLGRAKNAVLALLERRLSVPKIYIDAIWDGVQIDVLAFNRDGAGDVHAVLVFPQRRFVNGLPDILTEVRVIEGYIEKFNSIHAHYKYLAGVAVGASDEPYRVDLSARMAEKTFAPNGLGRVGFITVEAPEDDEPSAQLVIKPERFRAKITDMADMYMREHSADWEVRI